MPDLIHTLQGHDLNFLKMVAGLWGVELNAPDARTALPVLVQSLLDSNLVKEMVETLPKDARLALQTLLENEGQLGWAVFSRRYGEVRAMGAAWRDRERPDLKPASPAEVLWYRGIIGRAFLNMPPEPQEFAYIPDDLLELLSPFNRPAIILYGRPASPSESVHQLLVNDEIVDQACTMLAALRMGLNEEEYQFKQDEITASELRALLDAAGLLGENLMPLPEPTRAFLEAPRGKALALLAESWMNSTAYNDLRHVSGLVFEGEWRNDPLRTRQAVLEMLTHLPQGQWWSLASFLAAVRDNQPDFQRPAGDYDSWFIKQAGTGEYLRGFSSWEEVDGAVIRHLISGPLHWLGILDLACPAEGATPAAFRTSKWAMELWHGKAPQGLAEETEQVKVLSDGRITAERLTPRAARYQIARFCNWLPGGRNEYRYLVTPSSLERASKQGLRPAQLIALLRRYAAGPLPPTLVQAIERWETAGTQVRFERVILLRVTSPEILAAIRQTRAARFLKEDLNTTTAIVKPGSQEKLVKALAETGYLADACLES